MKALISLAVKRPVAAAMFFIALAVFGVIAGTRLPVEYLPDISVPKLIVAAPYRGLPASETRDLVVIPLEDALSTLRGVSKIKSTTRDGLGIIELSFAWGTDMTVAAVEAREVIDAAFASLPSESQKPMVLPVSPGERAVLTIGVFPKRGNLLLTRRLADREIKTQLQQVPGVGSITLIGGSEQEVKIDIDQEKMNARGVGLDQVAGLIGNSNVNYPAGSITEGPLEYVIKTSGKVKSPANIGELILTNQNAESFRISDIAEISVGEREQASLFQLNGREGIGLMVRRQAGKSPVSISAALRRKLIDLSESFGRDVEFEIIQDSSVAIKKSVADVALAAFLGSVVAFFILLLFTGRLNLSVIIILSIPFSIALALVLMMVSGISLNIMSLGGLALGIGMLVDNSVVVLDNLRQRCQLRKNTDKTDIIEATAEMAGATFGSTLTSIIVFMPVIFLPGIIGALFKDLSLAVIYALAASFLISVTLVPVLYSKIATGKITEKSRAAIFRRPWYTKLYGRLFGKSLKRPFFPLLALIIIGAVTALVLPMLHTELFEKTDSGQIDITVTLPPGTSMDWVSEVGTQLSNSVMRLENIKSIAVYAGGEENDPYFLADPKNGKEIIHGMIILKNKRDRSVFEIIKTLEAIVQLRDSEITINIPDEIIGPLLGADNSENTLLVFGDTPEEAAASAFYLKDQIKSEKIFQYISLSPSGEKAQIHLIPDRDAIAAAGYSLDKLANFVRDSVFGNYASRLTINGRDINIRVRLQARDRNAKEKLYKLTLPGPNGNSVRLSEFFTVETKYESPILLRQDRKDIYTITLTAPTDPAAGTKLSAITAPWKNVGKGAGSVFREYGTELIITFALALLLLYLILGTQFQSFSLPMLLMLCLPFSFGGIIPALYLTGHSINLYSILGFLVLLGITINNSIVLYETFKQRIEKCPNVGLIIYRGSSERVRPILMTTFTTVMALIPLAVDPGKTSTQSGMAVSIIGGLLISTLLSLFIMPLVFHRYFSSRMRKKND
ncbi:MAG: efflux RND transporter permease subunit [Spirochaetales bacterium]|nr:efflux RND transporter permease subunit [Spirochaetales bacterium]